MAAGYWRLAGIGEASEVPLHLYLVLRVWRHWSAGDVETELTSVLTAGGQMRELTVGENQREKVRERNITLMRLDSERQTVKQSLLD